MNLRWRGSCGVMLLVASACQSTPIVGADSSAFPDSWFGTWRGECALHRADGRQPFPMGIEIGPWEGDRCRWHILYGEGESVQRRAYDLIAVDPDAGHYAIDENNGIVLDSYLRAGVLYTAFEVQGSRLLARYEWVGDAVEFEIVITDVEVERTTGGGEVPEVQGFAVPTVQRATLRRAGTGKNG